MDTFDGNKASSLLGWKTVGVKAGSLNKILRTGIGYTIAEQRNDEKVYILDDFPELSDAEARLIGEAVDRFVAEDRKGEGGGIAQVIAAFCSENNIHLEDDQKKYMLYILNLTVSGFGFVSSLLSNDNIEEIAIIGLGKEKPVYAYEKNFGWLKTNSYFSDEIVVKNLVNKMAQQIGRHITLQKPRMNAVLPDGSRLSASFPPISFEPVVTLRKFREKPYTPPELIANNTISAEAMAFLWMALQTDSSILIAGNTGSGKTTLLNALFSFVPSNERIVITEETPEISIPHRHIAKVHVVENIGIKMTDLIVDTLRMRPDRIIIGEVRDEGEAKAFMDTLLAGQGKGSYATFHSRSSHEAIARMRKLGINEVDLQSIDLVIVQKRWNRILHGRTAREERHTTEICEILENNGKAKLNMLFEFSFEKWKMVKVNDSIKLSEKMANTFGCSNALLEKELEKRKKWLERKAKMEGTMQEFFGEVNDWQS